MKFKDLLAQYVIGILPTGQLPQAAIVGIEEGYDSPSLYILAGLEKNESPFVVERYLELTLDELDIKMSPKKQAALAYAIAVSEEIIEHKLDIIKGISDIKSNVLDKYDFFLETKKFVYDSVFFEKVYGLYDTYDELSTANTDWINDISNNELMAQIKGEMLDELKKWNAIMKTNLSLGLD